MANYKDVLRDIQNARYGLSNQSRLQSLKQKVETEQKKYTEAKQQLKGYLDANNVIAGNNQFSFYKPSSDVVYQNISANRVTLPYYDKRTDYEKQVSEQPYLFAKTETENQKKYEQAMQTEEGQQKKKQLMEQTNALGYAKFDLAQEQVNQDEIGWYDKSLGNVARGFASFFDINNGIVYDEKGNTVELPSKLELKNQKVNESYETWYGKILGNAAYEGTRILTSTALNAIAPYTGTTLYFGDMFRDSYNGARREGYDGDKALLYATLSTASEVIVGKALGSATKWLTGGKSGAVDTAVKKAVSKLVGDNRFSDFVANASSEAIEEFVQEFIDGANKKLVLDSNEKVFTVDRLKDALYSAGVGALTGGTLGGHVDVNEDLKTNINKNNLAIMNLNNQLKDTTDTTEANKISKKIEKLEAENVKYNEQIQENIKKYKIKDSGVKTVEDLVAQDKQKTTKPIQIDQNLQQRLSQPTQLPVQSYNTDLSNYKGTQLQTYQNAINSGLLNNNKNTHDFVDFVGKISKDKDIVFNFTNNQALQDRNINAQINGFIDKNGITVNIDSNEALEKVIGHEVTHTLESMVNEYNELKNSFKTLLGEEYNTRLEQIKELYNGIEGANYENELISDLAGEYLFTNEEFINNLSTEKPSLFKRIYNEIKYLWKMATGTEQEKQLAKTMRIYENAYRNAGKATTQKTQYSISQTKEVIDEETRNKYQEMLVDIRNNEDDAFLNKFRTEVNRKIPGFFNKNTNNMGVELSKQQQKYFKDSKARGINDSLTTVYHTMTNRGIQFNEFNPVGTPGYRFGEQVVNYYTDSKQMSGSYADQDYEMAATKKITNVKDANNLIKEYNNKYDSNFQIEEKDGKYIVADNTYKEAYNKAMSIWNNEFTQEDKQKLKDFNEENKRLIETNEFLTAKAPSLDEFAPDVAKKIDNISERLNSDERDILSYIRTYFDNFEGKNIIFPTWIQTEPIIIGEYESKVELFKNLKSALQKANTDSLKKYQYEGYLNITNPYVVDADGNNWNSVKYNYDENSINKYLNLNNDIKEKLTNLVQESNSKYNIANNRYNELKDTMENHLTKRQESLLDIFNTYLENDKADKTIIASLHGIYDDIDTLEKEFNSDTNFLIRFGNTTLKQFARYYNEVMSDHQKYPNVTSYFYEQAPKLLEGTDIKANNDTWYIAGQNFKEADIRENFEQKQATNDIVKQVIASNQSGETNYDGVIIKNVVDYGGRSQNYTPQDIYVTFNSNQFKAVDNLNPTEDADIRYQISKQDENLPKGQFRGKSVARDTNIPTTQESVLNVPINKSRKVLNPTEISNLKPENANTTPILPTTQTITGDKSSRFLNNLNKTEMLSKESKNLINNANIGEYKSVTNEESLKEASKRLQKGGKAETERWLVKKENFDASDVAEGFILLNQYQEIAKNSKNATDKYQINQSMVQVAKKLRQMGTEAGQTVQAYSILSRMTPEGMVYYAQSELTDAYNKMVKNKTKEWIDKNRSNFELTPDETQFILDTMQEVSKMEDGYEKKVKLAEIQKLMTDKLPPEKGQKLKSWMRLSMLFNPKTQVRNIAGNALIAPVNSFGDIFASYADKLISKKTKVRTTGKTNIKAMLEGFKKGAYEATTDYKKGINTRDIEGNRFEIGDGKSFSDKNIIGKALNNTESLLNYVMDAGDRVFSEAAFENSLQNQLKLNNTTEVTQDMIDIARQEALSRTWNDNNNYTQFVLSVRSMLNKINVGTYGLGDVLIPFAKTPANLTKAIVDYSPVGLVNTMLKGRKLSRSLENGQYTPQLQHDFVQTLGKATAGTMLYVLGMALAKAGITSGESDDDKDTQNFLKNTLGVSNYSIKIGGKSFTYDWAQPIAAPLSITANIVNRKDKEQALGEAILSNLDTASSVLLEQSFMQGINEVLNGNGGIVDGLINQVLSLPARAIPTLSKQIVDLTDSTQRTSFEYGKPVQSAINAAKAKIPGLSQTLAPVVDTMGREVERYGGKNNIFNVFLNPASVNTENISEAASEIYKIYQATGDKTIMPRVAPYYINSKGEKITLNSKQKAEFQTISGSIIEENMNDLINNQAYQILNDNEKASMINDLVNYAYNKARKDILGIDMSNEYNKINEYVNDGGTPAEYYTNKEEINYAYTNPEKYSAIKQIASYNEYQTYNDTIKDIKEKYSTSNERKSAIINYVNGLPLNIPQKAMLIKMYYSSFKQYDNQIIEYINSQDLTKSQKSDILKEVGFNVRNGVVYK